MPAQAGLPRGIGAYSTRMNSLLRTLQRALIVTLVLGAHGSGALAEPQLTQGTRHALGDGLSLVMDANGLKVQKAKRRAPLTIGGIAPSPSLAVSVKASGDTVELSFMRDCDDLKQTYSKQQLEALLDLEEGKRLAGKGKLGAAEVALARAHTRDPALRSPLLVDVRLKLGQLDAANRALAAMVAAAPLETYVTASLDPARKPFLDLPALTALRATTPGTAAIDAKTLHFEKVQWARSPSGWLARVNGEDSRGCYATLSLKLYDEGSLAPLAKLELASEADVHDCDDEPSFTKAGSARIEERVTRANRLLAELGFEPLVGEDSKESQSQPSGAQTLRFDSDRLGMVVAPDGAVRWFRQGKLLKGLPAGTIPPDSQRVSASRFPNERWVLVTSHSHECEWKDRDSVTRVPLP